MDPHNQADLRWLDDIRYDAEQAQDHTTRPDLFPELEGPADRREWAVRYHLAADDEWVGDRRRWRLSGPFSTREAAETFLTALAGSGQLVLGRIVPADEVRIVPADEAGDNG